MYINKKKKKKKKKKKIKKNFFFIYISIINLMNIKYFNYIY